MTKKTTQRCTTNRQVKTNSNGVSSPVHKNSNRSSGNIASSINESINQHRKAIDILSKR